MAAAGGPKTFVNALGTSGQSAPRFKHGDLNLRLLSLSPNGRSEIWRVAWHDLRAHPVLGSGDGSFAQLWLTARTDDLPAVAAHSLYLETAAELGIVGLLCLITFLVLPLIAAGLVRDAPMAPALAGAFAGALVQQAFDWPQHAVEPDRLAVVDARHIPAQRLGQGDQDHHIENNLDIAIQCHQNSSGFNRATTR